MGKPSLRQIAYEKIHTAIMNGQFLKGTVTSEGELSRMLDMSRTPIRSALQQLELEGYIRIASKHGIIILDSSSERTGNLLEMIVSLVLFSFHAAWASNREQLFKLASSKAEQFRQLTITAQEDNLNALTNFEYQLLLDLVLLSNNAEMERTFTTSTSRLFWNHNIRRWQAPYRGETLESISKLIDSLTTDKETFSSDLFTYLRILKRTWL